MNSIILYSTGCRNCRILEKLMEQKKITPTQVVSNEEEIISKGMLSVPYLEINGERMDFYSAVKWVNQQEVT